MRMVAYVLAFICLIAAVVYFTTTADHLPAFMPGYEAGSQHIHKTHAIAAVIGAVILFVLGSFAGRRA